MWMYSKIHQKDVFVVKVQSGHLQKVSEPFKTLVVVHGDIATYFNPNTCKWEQEDLDEFKPPIYNH